MKYADFQEMTFDDLVLLTRDEELFKSECDEMIEDFIQQCPPEKQLKMRHIQAMINKEKRHRKDPLACASKIFGMMIDSLNELNDAFAPFKSND